MYYRQITTDIKTKNYRIGKRKSKFAYKYWLLSTFSYSTNFSTTVPNGLPDKWGTKSNIFFDVANVWGKDFSEGVDSNKIRSSAGVGFEWVSPLGPISFTYAEPITKDSTDSIEKFNFKLGGIF